LDVLRRRTPRSDRTAQPGLTESLNAVRDRITSGPVPSSAPPRFGTAQRLARRSLLRLLKPVTVHAQLVDGQLLEAIRSLDARLGSLASEHAVVRRRVQELQDEVDQLRHDAGAKASGGPEGD
jgi:hypothetical protein